RSDLNGSSLVSPQEAGLFGNRPDIASAVAGGGENEIAAVWSPTAAAVVGSRIPSRKERTRMAAVGTHLPERVESGLGLVFGVSQSRSVGRPTRPIDLFPRPRIDAHQRAHIGPVRFG